jgi:hypothetical protein
MTHAIQLPLPGTLGNIVGKGADGVLIGKITPADPTAAFLMQVGSPDGKVYADDGGAYTDFSTEAAEGTADDVELLPATPAAEDATYFGLPDETFERVDIQITTQGAGTWTITWEYWDGDAWQTLTVTDGTTGFTAAAGTVSVTFTAPSDWAENTVDSVKCYWIRARVSAYTSVTTQPLAGQVWVIGDDAFYTDDLADLIEATADDVALTPAAPVVGDGFVFGYSEQFNKIKITTSTAGVATWTVILEYWDGDSWETVDTYEDDTAGWTTTAGTLFIHFRPPADWARKSIEGTSAYYVRMKISAFTSITTQPLATQAWVLPCSTGCSGFPCPVTGFIRDIRGNANTVSGTTADSTIIIVNGTRGTVAQFDWTKGEQFDEVALTGDDRLYVEAGDELLVVQVTEDGTTELADASLYLTV